MKVTIIENNDATGTVILEDGRTYTGAMVRSDQRAPGVRLTIACELEMVAGGEPVPEAEGDDQDEAEAE